MSSKKRQKKTPRDRKTAGDGEDFRNLATVSDAEVADFHLLDRKTRQQVVEDLEQIASNRDVPIDDRAIARCRAIAYRNHMESKK